MGRASAAGDDPALQAWAARRDDLKVELASRGLAVYSEGGTYRYLLTRNEEDVALFESGRVGRRSITWILLNPSTASAAVDDPTLRRVRAFSRRLGFGRCLLVNLFAYRATDPRELLRQREPVGGERTGELIRLAVESAEQVVLGWGTWGGHRGRGAELVEQLAAHPCPPVGCLGVTLDGHPRHPLYRPRDERLVEIDLGRMSYPFRALGRRR